MWPACLQSERRRCSLEKPTRERTVYRKGEGSCVNQMNITQSHGRVDRLWSWWHSKKKERQNSSEILSAPMFALWRRKDASPCLKKNSFFKLLPCPCTPTLILQLTDFYRDGSASLQPCNALKTALNHRWHFSASVSYPSVRRGRKQVSLLTFTCVIRLLNRISGDCSS